TSIYITNQPDVNNSSTSLLTLTPHSFIQRLKFSRLPGISRVLFKNLPRRWVGMPLSKSVVRSICIGVLSCLVVLLLATNSFGQSSSTGTVIGVVTDPSGAAVSGATVTLVDPSTSVSRSTTANDDGQYTFANVPPGSYMLSATRTGFRATKIISQDVKVNVTSTINIRMEVGSVTETIEVTATNAELQTANATIGNTVSGDALDALPSISRDAATFVTLAPGVAPDGSVAGAVYDQNSFQLDGGQNTNDMDG